MSQITIDGNTNSTNLIFGSNSGQITNTNTNVPFELKEGMKFKAELYIYRSAENPHHNGLYEDDIYIFKNIERGRVNRNVYTFDVTILGDWTPLDGVVAYGTYDSLLNKLVIYEHYSLNPYFIEIGLMKYSHMELTVYNNTLRGWFSASDGGNYNVSLIPYNE